MEFFDSHAHYDDEKFDIDRDDILKQIYKEGVTKCINIGCDIETSKKSIELSQKYDYIYTTCALHPSELPQTEAKLLKELNKIKNLAKTNSKVVAIGEIGLDYYWNKDNKELQKIAFIQQINIANELGLPISIHTRDAIDDTIQIIRNNKVNKGGVLHCCPFNKELVRHGLDVGLYIAFGGTSTFKNSKGAEDIIKMVPLDRILIETDSPYLSPDPLRGKRNDSRNLKYIVEKIASIKNMSPEEIAKITYNNATTLFNITK